LQGIWVVPHALRIRGGDTLTASVGSARLHVWAQGQKRFVIALKYEGDTTWKVIGYPEDIL
jgi:hypothetical protein